MFYPESLFDPIVPPAGAHDPRPVLEETQKAAADSFRNLAAMLNQIAKNIESQPWCDTLVDIYGPALDTATNLSNERLAIFRATRDCQGQS